MRVHTTIARTIRHQRHGFSLLEILVVVAIMLILASVAGVYFFGYLDDADYKKGKSECTVFEEAAKGWLISNRNEPLEYLTLETLVNPASGNPLVAGGPAKMISPFGQQYILEIRQDERGNPEPIVYFIGKDGNKWSSENTRSRYPTEFR